MYVLGYRGSVGLWQNTPRKTELSKNRKDYVLFTTRIVKIHYKVKITKMFPSDHLILKFAIKVIDFFRMISIKNVFF